MAGAQLGFLDFIDKRLVLGIGAVVLLGSAWYGYRWYSGKAQKTAQLVFSECIAEFDKASSGRTDLWPNVETMCTIGYDKHSSSSVAPYFLALKAHAQLEQGKKADAVRMMEAMMNVLSSSSPLYGLYKAKYALMQLDSDDAIVKKKGLEHLQQLAEDTKNPESDMARYYWGAYYWANNEPERARQIWQGLLPLAEGDKHAQSPWAQLVQRKIKQISQAMQTQTQTT